jgi:hypothetical protein
LPLVLTSSTIDVKKMIQQLDRGFDKLKEDIMECLERHKIIVKKVVYVLTSLSPDHDENHAQFLEGRVKELFAAADYLELFGHMNFHWNYLDPSLLDHIVCKLDLEDVKAQMEGYKSNLHEFRMKTLLSLFCRAQKRKRIKFSPDFVDIAAEFTWPREQEITLEDVEQFRQEYASHYRLHEFAMMLFEVRPGSFLILWMVPKSITNILRHNVPIQILTKYFITKLTIAGACIYHCSPEEEEVQDHDPPDSDATFEKDVGKANLSTEPSEEIPCEAEGSSLIDTGPFEGPCQDSKTATDEPQHGGGTEVHVSSEEDVEATDAECSTESVKSQTPAGGSKADQSASTEESINYVPADETKLKVDDHSVASSEPGNIPLPSGSLPQEYPLAQEYPFVEEPSQDFYCPVTYDVMVEPHFTSCCGKNLSERAVFRIQREGNPCPLCRRSNWSTLLNKELQDMVGALRVFCPHVDRGCKWKGKLRQFDSHVEHCSKGDAPVQESTRETVLHDAAKRGDDETVQRLLSAGNVDINSTNAITGETALHLSSKGGHVEVVCLLVKAGADLNTVDKNNRTPLFWASARGHTKIVEILLKGGADFISRRKDGVSPLHVACLGGHTDVVDLLVLAGADIHLASTDKYGSDSLMIAATKGHTATVQRILEAGATVNYQRKAGWTPLVCASLGGHIGVVKLLLEKGADVNICSKVGMDYRISTLADV